MPKSISTSESRSLDQLREHYLIERELANRLRTAGAIERRALYTSVYDELFHRVPLHPSRTMDRGAQARSVARLMTLIEPLLAPDQTVLDVGCGDGALACNIAQRVARVYGVDVSHNFTQGLEHPDNFSLAISDGTSIPLEPDSIDLAVSNQLMEHLHPDDALEQLRNVFRVLKPGGRYLIITPNRLSGPHDISMYFDDNASGFHLKEYTVGELVGLLGKVGFGATQCITGGRGVGMRIPTWTVAAMEAGLGSLPRSLARSIARRRPLSTLLNIRLLATKPGGGNRLDTARSA